MSDPRWTDETVERVADALRSYDEEHEVWFWEDLAIEALGVLADAGLLLTEVNVQAAANAVLDAIGEQFRAKLLGNHGEAPS